jgi:hypothetical protein
VSATDNAAFPERKIDASQVIWQALAAVIDGMNDEEAAERLETLTPEQLRIFHFQLDRIRAMTGRIRSRKMKEADAAAKQEHEEGVIKPRETGEKR